MVAALMGHSGAHRIRVVPLPTVGHRHADGWVRRVMLTAPLVGEGAHRATAVLAGVAGNRYRRVHGAV